MYIMKIETLLLDTYKTKCHVIKHIGVIITICIFSEKINIINYIQIV